MVRIYSKFPGFIIQKDFQRDFLRLESKLTESILKGTESDNFFTIVGKFFSDKNFREVVYDYSLLKLTGNNYKICSKFSKRLISSYQFCLKDNQK